MNWRMLKRVGILGGGVSATAAAIACARSGLSVVMVRPTRSQLAPRFMTESLAPVGGQMLRQLLGEEALCEVSRGTYWGIVRNGNYEPFDDLYGPGYHLVPARLIERMQEVARAVGVVFVNSRVESLQRQTRRVAVHCEQQTTLHCHAVIDASGERGPGVGVLDSRPRWLSKQVTVVQRLAPPSLKHRNQAHFRHCQGQWCWSAFDALGRCEETLELGGDAAAAATPRQIAAGAAGGIASQVRRCRWFIQENLSGGGIFLLGSAAHQVSPVTGLGMTLGLSGALHVATLLAETRPRAWRREELAHAHAQYLRSQFWACFQLMRGLGLENFREGSDDLAGPTLCDTVAQCRPTGPQPTA